MMRPRSINVSWCLNVFFPGDCPSYLNDILTSNRDIHSRNSRHGCTNLVSRETKGGRSFAVSVSCLWNSLPSSLKKYFLVFNYFNLTYILLHLLF